MSRKKRVEKRTQRQQQQKRLMVISGIVVVAAAVVFAVLLIYSAERDRRHANETATAIVEYYNRQTEVAAEALTPQSTEEALRVTETAEAIAGQQTQVAEAVAPRQTEFASAINTQVAAAAQIAEEDFAPTIVSLDELPSWDEPPEMIIDPDKTYLATFVTEKGPVVVELFAKETPMTVNNFIFLARQGYYDNTTFHRVLDDFMAQGGDPSGTGRGGPGYEFEDEIVDGITFDRPGLLAMANPGDPNTNGSQFFITYVPLPQLDGQHTIFGQVIEGQDVAESLTRRDPQEDPDFLGDTLLTVEITEIKGKGDE